MEIPSEFQVYYDYSRSFAQQVDDYLAGKIPEMDTLALGETPELYQQIGLSALPMVIDQKHVESALYGKLLNEETGERDKDHNMGVEMLKKLPELLRDPVAIIETTSEGRQEDSVLVIVKATVNGHQQIAAIEVNGRGVNNGETVDANRVTSTYGRRNAIEKLKEAMEKENGAGVYYIKKVEARSLFTAPGVQFPGFATQDGLIHSIFDVGAKVNRKFLQQTETRQFKRWFEGSVIKNEDGTPKVMYHGTPYGGYTVFKDWQYFTNDRTYADKYQNPSASSIRGRYDAATNPTTYEVYLSVKKPFDTRDPETRKLWEEEFYDKYSRTPLTEKGLPDWTDGIDLVEFIEENGYDYDGIILDEGGTGGYGEEVKSRGVSVVVRSSEQIKSATDNIGTFDRENPDIRYFRQNFRFSSMYRSK